MSRRGLLIVVVTFAFLEGYRTQSRPLPWRNSFLCRKNTPFSEHGCLLCHFVQNLLSVCGGSTDMQRHVTGVPSSLCTRQVLPAIVNIFAVVFVLIPVVHDATVFTSENFQYAYLFQLLDLSFLGDTGCHSFVLEGLLSATAEALKQPRRRMRSSTHHVLLKLVVLSLCRWEGYILIEVASASVQRSLGGPRVKQYCLVNLDQ